MRPKAEVDRPTLRSQSDGLQVKKQDMPRGEVLAEMKPQPTGEIRPVIAELAKASGAYIIVSGAGSTADSALRSRRDAMAEAVKGMPDAEKLTLDFYDRGRMATWVRSHAGLIPWVRSKIGKSIPGWRAYGSWSYRPEGVDAAYLVESLDAQYDAASAYIKSQAHAGWTLIRSRYDDGGYSGGSTDRPDLQKLLDDIRARKVDVIVVYKVDPGVQFAGRPVRCRVSLY